MCNVERRLRVTIAMRDSCDAYRDTNLEWEEHELGLMLLLLVGRVQLAVLSALTVACSRMTWTWTVA
jgi:hypothetical protein